MFPLLIFVGVNQIKTHLARLESRVGLTFRRCHLRACPCLIFKEEKTSGDDGLRGEMRSYLEIV